MSLQGLLRGLIKLPGDHLSSSDEMCWVFLVFDLHSLSGPITVIPKCFIPLLSLHTATSSPKLQAKPSYFHNV